MKVRALIIAALLGVSASAAFAGDDEPRTGFAVVSAKGSSVFKVIYKSETSARVKLNIYDQKGSVIFTETLAGVNGFMVPLNFTGLASGEYTIELVGAGTRKIERVSYQPQSNIKQVRVSKISAEEGKYMLAVSSAGNEVIHVKIFDKNQVLVHEESKSIEGDFAQVYKFSNIASDYTFEITDNAGNTKTVRF